MIVQLKTIPTIDQHQVRRFDDWKIVFMYSLFEANPFYLPTDVKSTNGNEHRNSTSPRPVRRCHVCQQEFRNKALLRMHINTFHSNETKKSPPLPAFPITPATNLGFLQPFVDTTSPLAHKLVAGQAPQASYGILHDSYFCAKMADRVVCEICNKQVCNKYFLKTHKGTYSLS